MNIWHWIKPFCYFPLQHHNKLLKCCCLSALKKHPMPQQLMLTSKQFACVAECIRDCLALCRCKFSLHYSNPDVKYVFFSSPALRVTSPSNSYSSTLKSWQWWMSLIDICIASHCERCRYCNTAWQAYPPSQNIFVSPLLFLLYLFDSCSFSSFFLLCLHTAATGGREGRNGRRRCSSE